MNLNFKSFLILTNCFCDVSGGRGGYGGDGDRRRDNYRDGAGSGPDRHRHSGIRHNSFNSFNGLHESPCLVLQLCFLNHNLSLN